MRALVAGSAGQLGRELVAQLGGEVAWKGDRDELDVTDGATVAALVARVRPDVVFNATAFNRVDAAEAEPLAAGGEHLVVRTSGVLGRGGSEQKGGSFVGRIVAQARAGQPLRVVDDQIFAPTCASDLAAALVALVRAGARGLVHVTNAGSCSWHELAVAALAAAGLEAPVARIRAAELHLPARRPAYSVLDTSRATALGLPPPRHWKDALPDCLPRASPPI